jgi:phosphoribosylformylglycinamidine synthase
MANGHGERLKGDSFLYRRPYMTYRIHVRIVPRDGLLDPQGQAVEHALTALGFAEASNVRIGKAIELSIDARSPEDARTRAKAMCDTLLANPVTEDYLVEVER